MGRLNSRRLRTSDASSERPGDIRKASSPSARTTVLPRIFKPLSAQGMVEYALGLALSLYLIMGVVDFGRGFLVHNILANVAAKAPATRRS